MTKLTTLKREYETHCESRYSLFTQNSGHYHLRKIMYSALLSDHIHILNALSAHLCHLHFRINLFLSH